MGRASALRGVALNGLDAAEEGREMEMKPGRTPRVCTSGIGRWTILSRHY